MVRSKELKCLGKLREARYFLRELDHVRPQINQLIVIVLQSVQDIARFDFVRVDVDVELAPVEHLRLRGDRVADSLVPVRRELQLIQVLSGPCINGKMSLLVLFLDDFLVTLALSCLSFWCNI